MKKTAALLALLATFAAGASVPEGFSLQARGASDEEGSWDLFFKGEAVGRLPSIGGEPHLIEAQEVKAAKKHPSLLLLEYEAGSAGTSVITQLDRLAVLVRDEKGAYSLALDIPLSLSRHFGEKTLFEERRKLVWEDDYSGLKAGALDEYPESRFVFKNGKFVPR